MSKKRKNCPICKNLSYRCYIRKTEKNRKWLSIGYYCIGCSHFFE